VGVEWSPHGREARIASGLSRNTFDRIPDEFGTNHLFARRHRTQAIQRWLTRTAFRTVEPDNTSVSSGTGRIWCHGRPG
jgi:hypothetical protein